MIVGFFNWRMDGEGETEDFETITGLETWPNQSFLPSRDEWGERNAAVCFVETIFLRNTMDIQWRRRGVVKTTSKWVWDFVCFADWSSLSLLIMQRLVEVDFVALSTEYDRVTVRRRDLEEMTGQLCSGEFLAQLDKWMV